jgi:very-short-patch-repair endonuclease
MRTAKERYADRMRERMTPPEALLWSYLRREFRHCRPQKVLGSYIVDFAFPSKRLAVEVDGSAHDGREAYDAERDAVLARYGWRVVRFSNQSVMVEAAAVVDAIGKALDLPRLPRLSDEAERPTARVGDAVQFGCAVRKWKRLNPPVAAVGRLVRKKVSEGA